MDCWCAQADATIILKEKRETLAGSASEPGIWLSLESFRQLPLDPQSRCELLQRIATEPQTSSVLASCDELQLEAAEATASSMLAALEHARYQLAVERQSELCSLLAAISDCQPQLKAQLWKRYGELLATLVAHLHPVLNANNGDPPEANERAELCWRLMELLEDGHERPFEAADWLGVLERQLVQDGSQFWLELGNHERCIGMTLRLASLLDPAPDWVLQRARSLIEHWLQAADWLVKTTEIEVFAKGCRQLGSWLKRWPLQTTEQEAMELALLRMELSLQLLEHESHNKSVQTKETQALELVIRGEAEPQLYPCQFNLAPLLSGGVDELENALQAFVAGQRAQQPARNGFETLKDSLTTHWMAGRRLPIGSYGLVNYALASWKRQLGDRHPEIGQTNKQGCQLIELQRYELAVLLSLSRRDAALEPAMAELRRQHLNFEFWKTAQTGPWYGIPTALESLKNLHHQGGFYAGAQAPLESLRSWGQSSMTALLGADVVWIGEASCQGLWLALGQQLEGQLTGIQAPPNAKEWLRELEGNEVVYVGWNWPKVKEAHRSGSLFGRVPFGLRGLEPPDSRGGLRPNGDFQETVEQCLKQLDELHQKRPFSFICSDAGAYRLPLIQAARNRYGTRGLACMSIVQWLELDQP